MKEDKSNHWIGKESDFQKAVAKYLDLLGLLWFHPPNGGTRNVREAVNLKAQGVKKGISDIIILEPRGIYHGLMIELKTKTGRLSPNQKEFMSRCEDKSYRCKVCRSFDDVQSFVDWYMALEKNY